VKRLSYGSFGQKGLFEYLRKIDWDLTKAEKVLSLFEKMLDV
jgi:hypothetical protein